MFDIGFSELLVIGVLGLIILGPERLPKAARTVGLLIGKMRRTMSGIQQEIEQEVRNQEIREKLQNPLHSYLTEDELKQREETEELDRMANGEASAEGFHEFGDHSNEHKDHSESSENSILGDIDNNHTRHAPETPLAKEPK